MIKKSIFIILAVFGLGSVAEMHSADGVDHMSDMISDGSAVEESGFKGSVELRYEKDEGSAYRVRLGWTGDVNEAVSWGVGLSTGAPWSDDKTAENPQTRWHVPFNTPGGVAVALEQAYVSYSLAEDFSVKVGKYGHKTSYHKTGVLYDDDLYPEGAVAKYHYKGDGAHCFVKAGLYQLDSAYKGPFTAGSVLKGKAGGHYELSEGVTGGVYVSAEYDGLFNDGKKTLVQAGVKLSADVAVPVGVFGIASSDAKELGLNSYTGGAYVGNAGSPSGGETGDFGLAVSYHKVDEGNFNTALVDTDYFAAGASKGVSARAQYNVWDGANVVGKYAYNLGSGEKHNVVGELTFNF